MRGLKIFEVNPRYIKYLSGIQDHLFISDGDKSSRMIIASIVDAIRIITGLKRNNLEKLLKEPQDRMNDEKYVMKLTELGYISNK